VNRLAKRAVISSKRASARFAPAASSRDLFRWRREITRSLSDRSRASEENCFSSSYAVVSPVYDYAYAASGMARARASACDNRASMVRSA
jgi:hypothetical protein